MYNNINLIKNIPNQRDKHKSKKKFWFKVKRFFLLFLAAYFIISFILSFKVIFSQNTFVKAISKLPVVNQIRNILGGENILAGKNDDRVNFLLMGIGGKGHEGALLTDTIILASIQLSTDEITLISIPRDLYIKIPDDGWQRINHANAYGELNGYTGGGSALMAKTIETTFDIPIDYWLRIDFSGFKKVIDDLDGIDIQVDHTFTDKQFPTADFGVQIITFERGEQHLDGKTALQFARSRHGNNGEGSDFARSKRQQKILMAAKNKILNWKILANPNRIYNIYNSLQSHIQTNMTTDKLTDLISLLRKVDFKSIKHYVIDDAPGGLLKPMITNEGAQVLVPKSGDLNDLQDFVKNIFLVRKINKDNTKIILVNGTKTDGLATYIGSSLTSWGFNIKRLATAPEQNFEKSVIYDLTNGQEKEALKILKKRMGANATNKIPEFIKPFLNKTSSTGALEKINANFLIVIGNDQQRAIQDIKLWNETQAKLEATKILEKNTTATNTTIIINKK